MHLYFLLLVKTINVLFLFIIFNLYQNPEISQGDEYPYSDFKIAWPNKIELLDSKQVRSIFMAVPVWEPGLTKEEAKQIESAEVSFLHYHGR